MAMSKVRSRSMPPARSCPGARLFGEQLVEVGIGVAHGGADVIEPVDERLVAAPVGDVAGDILARIELGLLGEEPHAEPVGQSGLAGEAVVLTGHDPQQRGLP